MTYKVLNGTLSLYSLTHLVKISLSRLVSEIFSGERQTDGRTTRTITIAGPDIVVDQLKSNIQSLWLECIYQSINQSENYYSTAYSDMDSDTEQ